MRSSSLIDLVMLQKVEECLKKEKIRVAQYMLSSSEPKLLEVGVDFRLPFCIMFDYCSSGASFHVF